MATKQVYLLAALGLLASTLTQAESIAVTSNHSKSFILESNLTTGKPIASVPFTFEKGVPIIKVNLNGSQDEFFVIDSGSARTLLNSDEASRLKIRISSSNTGILPGSGDGEGQIMVVARSLALKLDNTLVLKGDVPAISLTQLSKDLGIRVTGIIGYDLFRTHPIMIDYINQRFVIYKNSQFVPSPGLRVAEFSVDKRGSLPIIATEIGVMNKSLGVARVLIDTGFQKAVMITPVFAAQFQLEKLEGWKHDNGLGVGGSFAYLYGLSGWLTFGDEKLITPSISISQTKQGLFTKRVFDAILGGALLSKFKLIFDVPNGRVLLTKGEDQNPH